MIKFPKIPTATLVGIAISLFGVTPILFIFRQIAPDALSNTIVVAREISVFALAGLLLLLVVRWEGKDLRSIGLHGDHWKLSLLRSLLLTVISFALVFACLGAFNVLNIPFGNSDGRYAAVSKWAILLLIFRAGIVEEIFYRGYLMGRLSEFFSSPIIYLLLPSVIFGLLHYNQGIGGIIIAFVLSVGISTFYWKTRDLKATIVAHFIVDFIPNILLPLLSNG